MTSITEYKLMYQVAPVIMTRGVTGQNGAMNMLAFMNPAMSSMGLNGMTPQIAAMTQPLAPDSPVMQAFANFDLDEPFGAFTVTQGGSLLVNTVPKYPLADMTMAANAIVREPITLSLVWDTPMRVPRQQVTAPAGQGGIGSDTAASARAAQAAATRQNAWQIKFATMTFLKQMLELHNNLGGTYSVMTPAITFTDLIMTALTDVSRANEPVPQNAWRFDFERPMVVTEQDASNDQNILLSRITAGLPTNAQTSGPQTPTVPQPVESGSSGGGAATINFDAFVFHGGGH